MKMALSLLATLLVLLPAALAYPSGAPSGACTTMTPGHRMPVGINGTIVPPQTASSPYMIEVNSNTYNKSGSLTVTVTGGVFLGILLQARSDDGTLQGTFSNAPTNFKLTQCTSAGDSVTHTNSDNKSAGTAFTWNVPDSDVGAVKFTATVLQAYDVFWVMLQSDKVAYSGANWISVNLSFVIGLVIAAMTLSRE